MGGRIRIRIAKGIETVPAPAWDACAGTANPFVRHAFLLAAEASGSASARTGWAPHHLLAETEDGDLRACAPLYLKTHSYGEYVFDWSWADAWQRQGLDYYPKLQGAVPFTPATGPRLLVRPGEDWETLAGGLVDTMATLAEENKLSSAHVTFCTEAEARLMEGRGWLVRMGEQFHWTNRGWRDFDDFLGALNSRKRKTIRKEREQARALGLDLRVLTGPAIEPRHWAAFFRFYRDTVDRKWGQAYLHRDFFTRLGVAMADEVVLMVAERDGVPVAGALNLRGADTLFGRNWGSTGEFKFLHFELCYYQAIDFALAHGLARVEAGAQGRHKISRGYEPCATWSAHWICHAGLRRAVARFLEQERIEMEEAMRLQGESGPFRHQAAEPDIAGGGGW